MLCKTQSSPKFAVRPAVPLFLLLNIAISLWAPRTNAQTQSADAMSGAIRGMVYLKADHQPATQVAVKVKSHEAGIFRSVLTDYAGQFELKDLPPSIYEIDVEEPGYEPAQTSAKLEGSSAEVQLYLDASNPTQSDRSKYTVSKRELSIPEKARGEYQKGLLSLAKQDMAASLNHFIKAVKAFPQYYEAFYHVGLVETTMGKLDEAGKAFQASTDLSGGRYAWAQFGSGYLLYVQGKTEEAVGIISHALEVDGGSPDGFFLLGLAQLRLNRLEEAEKSAREALLRNPNFARAYILLSDSYGRQHNYLAQLQGLEAYLKLEPNGPESEPARRARDAVMRLMAKAQVAN